ncbi:hypothetical protein NPIL_178231 [Nephila pilipes]|uniref:Mos1 transposase HTH domain-containing protein n=1 Tax=Nephila pilipes TaxID=299642 RepID=A0A8X6N163_NEPPI|nr:hypothetical protein NPIL_178231 [Nephila pilipes]
MGWQLRVQRPPIRNISDLRDRCLNINLSPVIYQGLVASMPRRVEAKLRAKGVTLPWPQGCTIRTTRSNPAFAAGVYQPLQKRWTSRTLSICSKRNFLYRWKQVLIEAQSVLKKEPLNNFFSNFKRLSETMEISEICLLMKYEFHRGATTWQAVANINSVFGIQMVTNATVAHWFKKFR